MTKKREGFAKVLGMRRFLIVNLGLAVLIGWGCVGEYARNRNLKDEIESLRSQAAQMEERNAELHKMAEQFSGSSLLEREARLKLNLKKPGEEVVVVHNTSPAARVAEQQNREAAAHIAPSAVDESPSEDANFTKWINHFLPNIFSK
jgi:cell division protein FtsB